MLISTQTDSYSSYGDKKQVLSLLKEAGFTAYDFSLCGKYALTQNPITIQEAIELRAHADKIGILCNQTHAPFPSLRAGDDAYNQAMFPVIVEALQITSILGGSICVVHPCNDYSAQENAIFYRKLEPYAKKYGVKIALENMWNHDKEGHVCPAACSDAQSFTEHLSLLNPEIFVACLDLGHSEMHGLNTDCTQMIHALGDRLATLHIHDNDLVNDSHELPFLMKMDFHKIFATLKEAGYQGDVTFESNTFNRHFPKKLYPAAARFTYEVGAYLKELLEE